MKTRVFQYPACSTCRKALKWLREHSVDVEVTDIVTAPPSKAELRKIWKLSQLPIAKLFNTSGVSYRTGGFATRLKTLSDDEALDALSSDGKLIKRPLVVGTDFALIGFDAAAYAARFS
jgi:arsenate reductase (glutaredoxin)